MGVETSGPTHESSIANIILSEVPVKLETGRRWQHQLQGQSGNFGALEPKPKRGLYYDSQTRRHPLDESRARKKGRLSLHRNEVDSTFSSTEAIYQPC